MQVNIGDYVVCDMEFTCDDNKKFPHEVISIGAVKVHGGKIVDKLYIFVKPHTKRLRVLTQFCKDFTGITQESVDAGLDFEDALRLLKNFVGNCAFITWSTNDREVIVKEAVNSCLSPKHYDFLNKYRDLRDDISTYLLIKGKSKKYPYIYSLEYALNKLNLEISGRQHNAFADAYNTYKIATKVYRV